MYVCMYVRLYVCIPVCIYICMYVCMCMYVCVLHAGAYTFKVELTQMTAASSVELWLSTDSDPFSISKVLDFVYDDMVSA